MPHTNEWYHQVAAGGRGYSYPWRSSLGPGHPDEEYTQRVLQLVSKELDVVDCGCGHGEDVLLAAPFVRTIVGYDQIGNFVRMAEAARVAKGVENARFVVCDSSAAANDGVARIPAGTQTIDLFLSRRGPTHWIDDVGRAGRAGAVLLQLNPVPSRPPKWMAAIPEVFKCPALNAPDLESRLSPKVAARLRRAGVRVRSERLVDAPEWFLSPPDLYAFLKWTTEQPDIPPYAELALSLETLFRTFAGPEGLEYRRAGVLWQGELTNAV